jgi:hypothetical protein
MKLRDLAGVDWPRKSREWVDADVITSEQADAIVRYEGARVAASAPLSYAVSLSPLAEVMAYLAMVFTVASGTTLVMRSFRGPGAQLVTLGLVAVAALALGARVRRLGGSAWERIGGVLLAFATACATGFTALLLTRYIKTSDNVSLLLTSIFFTALSVALWRNRDRFFQMATSVGGLFWVVGSALALSGLSLRPWMTTMLFWLGGIAVVLLCEKIHPTAGALTIGWVVCLVAAPTLLIDSASSYLYGSLAGITTSAMAIGTSHFRQRRVLFIAAVIAMFFSLIRLFTHFAHSGAALAVVFLLSIGAMVVIVVRFITSQTGSKTPPTGELP